MSTALSRIREKACRDKDCVFSNLYHHISDVDHLRACFHSLDGSKAVGVDGMDKKTYAQGLEECLQDLSDRLKGVGINRHRASGRIFPRRGHSRGGHWESVRLNARL